MKRAKKHGVGIGNWLRAEQGRPPIGYIQIRKAAKQTRLRNRLGLFVGGLRLAELASLTMQDLQQREEHWVFADLVGEGGHTRTVPISDWVSSALKVWILEAAITTGPISPSIELLEPRRTAYS